MKHFSVIKSVLSVILLAAPGVLAQSLSRDTASTLKLNPPPEKSPNRIGLSYRMGFNAPVSFKHLGGFPAGSAARLTPDGDRYNYDNGYVLPDGGAPVNGVQVTRYWGYDSASQLSGDVMQRSSSAATSSSNDHYDTPTSGFELTYNRELIHKESWRGGLEGAFGYSYMSVHDASTRSANVTRVNDTYSFPSYVTEVPQTLYTGHRSSPPQDPVIIASPSSSTTDVLQNAATITGSRDFSADLFSFRLGPYIEIPLSKSIAFTLSGGLALMFVNSEFSYNETVTIPGVGSTPPEHASGSGNGWLPGAYVAGTFSVALSDSWAFVAGAQFEDLGQYTQTLNGKQATLDLSKSIFVTVGLSYSF